MPEKDDINNQMMYLLSWELLCRFCRENLMDKRVADNLNRKNAETLMCDLLPIA